MHSRVCACRAGYTFAPLSSWSSHIIVQAYILSSKPVSEFSTQGTVKPRQYRWHDHHFYSNHPVLITTVPRWTWLIWSPSVFPQWQKWGGAISGQYKCGAKTGRYVRRSFTVVYLHDLWSSCPRRIWDVIGLVYDKWERPGDKPKFWGHGPVLS